MRQRALGFSVLSLIVVVMAAVTASTLAMVLLRSRENVTALGSTGNQFEVIEKALVAYAAQNNRLPCPASGTAGTGAALPATATTTCTNAGGVVPWATLGISRDAATDAWGGFISYRVFAGNTGLTQTDGASMVNCDTAEDLPRPVTSTGGCRTQQDTLPASFLAGKGLTITDMGTARTDAAFVLISHGSTGRGGFSNANVARTAPATGGLEASNNSTSGPFFRAAASAPTVDPGNAVHFDDLVSYVALSDFMTKTGNVARNWVDAALDQRLRFTLNAATVSTALGVTYTTGQNTGQTSFSLDSGNALVQGFSTVGDATIGIRTSNGYEGIGIGGTTNIVAGSEFLDITFNNSTLRKFGVTLNEFGSGVVSGTPYRERVQLTFYNGATVVDSVIKYSCAPSNPLASFDVLSSAAFNRVRIEPLTAEPNIGLSSFLISAIRACPSPSSSCATTIATDVPTSVCP